MRYGKILRLENNSNGLLPPLVIEYWNFSASQEDSYGYKKVLSGNSIPQLEYTREGRPFFEGQWFRNTYEFQMDLFLTTTQLDLLLQLQQFQQKEILNFRKSYLTNNPLPFGTGNLFLFDGRLPELDSSITRTNIEWIDSTTGAIVFWANGLTWSVYSIYLQKIDYTWFFESQGDPYYSVKIQASEMYKTPGGTEQRLI